MLFKRNLDVQGAILGVWCLVLLLSCVVNAHQFDDTFDPITRRALVAGTQGRGGGHPIDPGHQPPPVNYKVIDVSRYPPAKGDGKSDSTPVNIVKYHQQINCYQTVTFAYP